jgi:hypothetical protein
MKDCSKITLQTAKELTTGRMGKSMKDFLKMGRNMVMAGMSIPMEIFSKVFILITSSKAGANIDGEMAKYTRDTTKMT